MTPRTMTVVMLALAGALAGCAGLRQPEPLAPAPRAREDVVREALASVVRIEADAGDGAVSRGSGFVVDRRRGLVVTNRHVIAGAKFIGVTLPDGTELEPREILGLESDEDLALLRLPGALPPALELRTDPPPQPAEDVLALGHPLGLSNTVTEGIVSGLREVEGRRMIQTSAAISAGNSGGPLVDRHGRVLGVVTWKVSALAVEGLGFATAAESLRALLDAPEHPMAVEEFYRDAVTGGGSDPRRRRAGAMLSTDATGFGGTWRPGPSDRIYIGLVPDGPNRFLGSLVVLKQPPHVLRERIIDVPPVTERRDFLLVRTGEGWTTEFGWIWECRTRRLGQRDDGTYVRAPPRSCTLPTSIVVHGRHGDLLHVTVTQPFIPASNAPSYALSCETCLEGAEPVETDADFERVATNVPW